MNDKIKKKIIISYLISLSIFIIIGCNNYALAGGADRSLGENNSQPKWTNPFDKLEVSIPNMERFTDPKPCPDDPSKMCVSWIGEYIAGIYKYGINIIGILAAIVIMVGGVIWLLAGGNSSKIGEAKKWIGASIGGLIIALASYTILYQINPNLTIFKPLKILQVAKIEVEFTSGGGTNNIPTDAATRNQYDSQIANAAKKYGVDCSLIKAILFTESSGNSRAISPKGAVGLMQLLPSTAEGLGSFDLSNIQDNINAGAAYIKRLLNTACNGAKSNSSSGCQADTAHLKYVIAAYNGGPKANRISNDCYNKTQWECEINGEGYKETRNYVNKVQANYGVLVENGWGCPN